MNIEPIKEELRCMLDKGMTLYQISRKYNTTIPVIFQLEKDYGIISQYTSPKMYRDISKEDLESMYIDEDMTQQQIAQELGYTRANVSRILRERGVPTRGRGKYNPQQRASKADEIVQRYNNGETIYQIAEEVGYTPSNVSRILRERGVSTRSGNGTIAHQKVSSITAGKIQDCIDKGMNQLQIAEYFNISDATIYRLAEKFNIPGMVNGYRFTTPEHREWRRKVLERDHYTCQMCGKTGVRLEVHHVIRWADAPELRYDVYNGVTLCHECHQKVTGHEYEYVQQFINITQPQYRGYHFSDDYE